MRYLVLTDIHGNLEALESVLDHAASLEYNAVLVLGDLVGYGADPNRVIDRIRELRPAAIVRGNHDKVAAGIEDAEGFNLTARNAVQWTFDALTPEHRSYLRSLPVGPAIVDDLVEICHGTPFDEDAYVFDELDAIRAIESARRPVCLFGHTHVPLVCVRTDGELEVHSPDTETFGIEIEEGRRYLVNPGSVGQPRDGDPRAATAIVDTDARRIELYRVPYFVEQAQYKVRAAGLPEVLAKRLALGR
ncbi:MAG TPA: metallophosphoesterase family protein [Vicinamibacterales bacterium]|nr:metallophosphoesterase family protein [Vicinamibacterales bacterium]